MSFSELQTISCPTGYKVYALTKGGEVKQLNFGSGGELVWRQGSSEPETSFIKVLKAISAFEDRVKDTGSPQAYDKKCGISIRPVIKEITYTTIPVRDFVDGLEKSKVLSVLNNIDLGAAERRLVEQIISQSENGLVNPFNSATQFGGGPGKYGYVILGQGEEFDLDRISKPSLSEEQILAEISKRYQPKASSYLQPQTPNENIDDLRIVIYRAKDITREKKLTPSEKREHLRQEIMSRCGIEDMGRLRLLKDRILDKVNGRYKERKTKTYFCVETSNEGLVLNRDNLFTTLVDAANESVARQKNNGEEPLDIYAVNVQEESFSIPHEITKDLSVMQSAERRLHSFAEGFPFAKEELDSISSQLPLEDEIFEPIRELLLKHQGSYFVLEDGTCFDSVETVSNLIYRDSFEGTLRFFKPELDYKVERRTISDAVRSSVYTKLQEAGVAGVDALSLLHRSFG